MVTATKLTSYLARHWRGDLSLGQAYWVNTVAGNAIFLVALTILVSATNDLSLAALSWLVLSYWLSISFCLIWQTVGVMRSAFFQADRQGRL